MSESPPCEWVEEQDALPLAGGGQHLAVGADVENVKKWGFAWIDSYKSHDLIPTSLFTEISLNCWITQINLNSMLKIPPGDPTRTCSLLNFPSPWEGSASIFSYALQCAYDVSSLFWVQLIIEGLPHNAEYHRRGSPNAQSEEEKIDPCREQKITNCTKSILSLHKLDLPIHPFAAGLLRSHTCVEGWACSMPSFCWFDLLLPSATSPWTSAPRSASRNPFLLHHHDLSPSLPEAWSLGCSKELHWNYFWNPRLKLRLIPGAEVPIPKTRSLGIMVYGCSADHGKAV